MIWETLLTVLVATTVFLVGEMAAHLIFTRIRAAYAPKLAGERSSAAAAARMGQLERLVLFIGLLMNFAVILAAFGAFKLGTRLHDDSKDRISNDYFLVGNLVSLLVVLVDVLLVHWLGQML